jgi:hypothetical protein
MLYHELLELPAGRGRTPDAAAGRQAETIAFAGR